MSKQEFIDWLQNFEKINYHEQFDNKVKITYFCEQYKNIDHIYNILNKFINIGWDLETVYYNDNKFLVIIDANNVKEISIEQFNGLKQILENCTYIQNYCKNKNKYFLQFY